MSVVRKTRAAVFFAVLWAVTWCLVGAVLGAVEARSSFPDYRWREDVRFFGVIFSVAGGITGLAFALGLMGAARRRALEAISYFRVGLVGAAAAEVPTAILLYLNAIWTWQGVAWTTVITAALGAICGAGTLAIARSGEPAEQLH